MKHFGMALDLKQDQRKIDQYRHYHANPWPEPLEGLRDIGVLEMKIFLIGNHLFMYMVTTDKFDIDIDFASYMKKNPRAADWDELMRTFQQRIPEAQPGEWWAPMDMVFDLDKHI